MTYVLCDVTECYHNDGSGCELETIDITRRADMQEQTDGLHRPRRAYCVDFGDTYVRFGTYDEGEE